MTPNIQKPSIALVVHEFNPHYAENRTLAQLILNLLAQRGHPVQIVRGIKKFVPADIAFAHIDLTFVPPDYVDFLSRYPKAINLHATDISRRKTSSHLIDAASPYDGPVIVKTNLNSGGGPERLTRVLQNPTWLNRLHHLEDRLMRRMPRPLSDRFSDVSYRTFYPVFEKKCLVPRAVFANPRLVVEKFRPERIGEYYAIRMHFFFKHKNVNILLKANHPFAKSCTAVSWEEVPAPEGILEIQEQLGIDYGKIDYTMHEGEIVAFDINKTTTAGTIRNYEVFAGIAPQLVDGIDCFC